MYAWHFTEMPYPNHPDPDTVPSVRVSLPSKHFDPKLGAELYNRYLDEHLLADDLGLNIMLNEHHQTATCLDVAAPLSGAILARQTTKARICILGNPMANRADPIRVAEEMAMIDVISKGRLDAGFVRGVPYEVFAANTNPTQTLERLWEGIDLCVKAWTTHDGKRLQIYDCACLDGSGGKPGEVMAVGGDGIEVAAGQGRILVKRVRGDGQKVSAADYAAETGLGAGTCLG